MLRSGLKMLILLIFFKICDAFMISWNFWTLWFHWDPGSLRQFKIKIKSWKCRWLRFITRYKFWIYLVVVTMMFFVRLFILMFLLVPVFFMVFRLYIVFAMSWMAMFWLVMTSMPVIFVIRAIIVVVPLIFHWFIVPLRWPNVLIFTSTLFLRSNFKFKFNSWHKFFIFWAFKFIALTWPIILISIHIISYFRLIVWM